MVTLSAFDIMCFMQACHLMCISTGCPLHLERTCEALCGLILYWQCSTAACSLFSAGTRLFSSVWCPCNTVLNPSVRACTCHDSKLLTGDCTVIQAMPAKERHMDPNRHSSTILAAFLASLLASSRAQEEPTAQEQRRLFKRYLRWRRLIAQVV